MGVLLIWRKLFIICFPGKTPSKQKEHFSIFFPVVFVYLPLGLTLLSFSFLSCLCCVFLKFITSNFLWSQVKDFPIEADKFNVEIRKCITDTHAHWRNSSNYQATKKWIKSWLRKVRGGTSPGNMKLFTFLRGSLRV